MLDDRVPRTAVGAVCYDSVPASATPVPSCPSGYTLVTTPLPFSPPLRQCKDSVAATATYSCSSGYTPSGTSCYKYVYTSPTGGSCPSGYTPFFNGFAHLCRKKVTTTATVTYDCDDAPAGYTLSGQDCVKTTTKPPTRPTIYYCVPGYTLNTENNTCSRTPTRITVDGCESVPVGEPRYELQVTITATTTTKTCTRTITIPAETRPTCPPPPEGERPYTLTTTHTSDGQTVYNCTNNADSDDDDDDSTTLPPPLLCSDSEIVSALGSLITQHRGGSMAL